jgi:molybdenum cofactor biosynthesis enzyme MoaA
MQKFPRHYPCETKIKSVSRFIDSMTDKKIGIVSIGGGEPFLHPQLPKFIESFSAYSDRISLLEIVTNGTVIPRQELLDALRSQKVNVLLDNYGPELSVRLNEVRALFDENKVEYRLRNYTKDNPHLNGWVDISDFSTKNRNDTEIESIFAQCALMDVYKNIFILIDGMAYMCYVNKKLLPFVDDKPDESVDL